MQAILSNLLTITLVVQSIFGCCRHGAAGELAGNAALLITSSSIVEADGCHDCDHCRKTGMPASPCHCKQECQGVCTYVRTAKVQIENATAWTRLILVPAERATSSTNNVTSISGADDGCNSTAPPLRLNLLNCVLLV